MAGVPPSGIVRAYRITKKEDVMFNGTVAITPIPIPGSLWTLQRLFPVPLRPVPPPRPDVFAEFGIR
jgi:hypothetical protein